MFPKKGLLCGIVGGVICYLCELPGLVAVVIGVVTFMSMGGWRYGRILRKTLPRDLSVIKLSLGILSKVKQYKKSKTTVVEMFVQNVNRHPDKTAIVYVNDGRKWTFRELNEYSNRVANHFRSQGLQRGNIVALFVENSPEFLGLFLGLAKIGVVSAFINYNLRQESLAHCINTSKASAVVFTADLSDAVLEILPELDPSISDMCYSVAGGSSIPQAKGLDGELELASTQDPPPLANKEFGDLLCYVFTSGTTGLPKACIIKGDRYYRYASAVTDVFGVGEKDLVYCTLPLYHTNGGILCSGQMVLGGSTLVLRKKFSASNFWADCVKHQCTVVFYIGELCRYLLAQPKRQTDTEHCVRMAIGNGLRPQIWQTFQSRFQVGIIKEFYGATEGCASAGNTVGKVGACGFMLSVFSFLNQLDLIKVNPETMEPVKDKNGFCMRVGVNEPGELIGRIKKGISEFDGYTSKEANEKKVFRDVFKQGDVYFRSGDILRMDEESFLYFCDRTGDTFRWKGENVSTAEVEAIIANILELRDVVVYGVEIPGMEGRVGMAAIAGDAETVDLHNLAKHLHVSLPHYAVPAFVRLVKGVDITGNFKFQKVRLRNEGYNLDVVSDPLYFLNPIQNVYVPFSSDILKQLADGSIRI